MKIMMPVEVVNDRCCYCKDFDADVLTKTISGMDLYNEDSTQSENLITVINEIRCTHFTECEWRAKHILGTFEPEKKPEPKKPKEPKKPATPRKKYARKEVPEV